MALLQDASFEEPKLKNWKKKYIQLDFRVSINELESLAKELRKEAGNTVNIKQQWLLTAFMEKCQCPQCKEAWIVFEKKQKELIR